jgi:hypothetical protein
MYTARLEFVPGKSGTSMGLSVRNVHPRSHIMLDILLGERGTGIAA